MSDEKKQSKPKKTTAKKVVEKARQFKPGVPLIKSVKTGGVELEFTESPTGQFGLAYNPGEKASFDKKQAEILIDAGVAKKV